LCNYIEEGNGQIDAYEFKYSKGKACFHQEFIDNYQPVILATISVNNFLDFIV